MRTRTLTLFAAVFLFVLMLALGYCHFYVVGWPYYFKMRYMAGMVICAGLLVWLRAIRRPDGPPSGDCLPAVVDVSAGVAVGIAWVIQVFAIAVCMNAMAFHSMINDRFHVGLALLIFGWAMRSLTRVFVPINPPPNAV